jgi:tripartite-type tricarboxylate transporter receptor subunit TctC
MQRRTFAAAAAATFAAPMSVRAQSSQPTRILVGFAPGGGTDILARVIAEKLTTMWGTAVIVENKAGATGVIAADYVAKQPPDGTTLLMAQSTAMRSRRRCSRRCLMSSSETSRRSRWWASRPTC